MHLTCKITVFQFSCYSQICQIKFRFPALKLTWTTWMLNVNKRRTIKAADSRWETQMNKLILAGCICEEQRDLRARVCNTTLLKLLKQHQFTNEEMRILGTKVIRLFNQNDKTEKQEQLPSFGPAVASEIKELIKSVKTHGFCKSKTRSTVHLVF